jgi:hypothetical protein
MTKTNRPGALASAPAGETILGRTIPNTTASLHLQCNPVAPVRIVGWQVDRWLGVSRLEVHHDR